MADPGRPALSVVVATRDRPDMLRACLDALGATLGPDDEVVVVDSCSRRPGTAAVVGDAGLRPGPGVRLLRCAVPGASRARNTGWRAAVYDHVAFVDDDVRVLPGWADALRTVLATRPEAAFVTGRLGLGPGARPVERPVAFLDADEARVVDADAVRDVGHGANLAVRRHALEKVGGYDERFGPGARWPAAEDLELLDRLIDVGFVGRYEPTVAAWHLQWRDRRSLVPLEWAYGTGQGARLVRLWRRDRRRARALARSALWSDGLRDLARCARRRYEFGALMAAVRLAATVRGAAGFALAGRSHPRARARGHRRAPPWPRARAHDRDRSRSRPEASGTAPDPAPRPTSRPTSRSTSSR